MASRGQADRDGRSPVEPRAQVVAHYLPQFHPIPENDEWWGPGFTEWTNVAQARRLFRGHQQPKIPGELGFYDLRVAETREAQAQLASEHGVAAFCYWHYWFGGGRRLLERPLDEVVASGEPDLPFCVAWANESWTGVWHGAADRLLIEQTYPGDEDHRAHFESLLPAFEDDRYFRVDGRPLFYVHQYKLLPEPEHFAELWRKLAAQHGLGDLYLVAQCRGEEDPVKAGFDAVTHSHFPRRPARSRWEQMVQRLRPQPTRMPYQEAVEFWKARLIRDDGDIPTVICGWDNTPRTKTNGWVLEDGTPQRFEDYLRWVVDHAINPSSNPGRLVFLKSWNEWAEGNYIEPDREYGRHALLALRRALHEGR